MAVTERVYKCLNPVGIEVPVDIVPLAPRLDTLDGKEIWISITGEPDITIPLERKLKMRLSQRQLEDKEDLHHQSGRAVR